MPRVEVPAFTGGLVTRISEEDLKPNQLSEASNITISKTIGAVETRRGLEIWDSLSFLSDMNMFWQNVFATSGLVIRNGNDFYVGDTIVYESMDDAETIFEIFDNWLVMCNGTRNLKYKDTGMALSWNSAYCFSFEKDYVVAAMFAAVRITKYSSESTYYSLFTWEVQIANGESPQAINVIAYTSTFEATLFVQYNDTDDIIFLDFEGNGVEESSKTTSGATFPLTHVDDDDIKLMLHMEGVDASTTFTDSSPQAHTVTRRGTSQIDTALKKFGDSSGLMVGGLTIPDHADWDFGSNPFTIDFWVRFSSVPEDDQCSLVAHGSDSNGIFFYLMDDSSDYKFYIYCYDGSSEYISSSAISNPVGTWHHIALIAGWGGVASSWAICYDGTAIYSGTPGWSWNFGSPLTIGYWDDSSADNLAGSIDEFRIIKGTAKWTSNFTPFTVAYPDSSVSVSATQKKFETQSLLCYNGYTKTDGDDTLSIRDSDFTLAFWLYLEDATKTCVLCEQVAERNDVLLLHMNGSDESTTFTDSSPSGHTVTANGDAQLDTAYKKFGTASGKFDDATGDYLSIPDSADFHFGDDPFTIDWWMYVETYAFSYIFDQITAGDDRVSLFFSSGGGIWFNVNGNVIVQTGAYVISIGAWHHVALIRGWGGNEDSWAIVIDGANIATSINAVTLPNVADIFYIGDSGYTTPSTYGFTGWLDDFRITKGAALWTASFVVPSVAAGNSGFSLSYDPSGTDKLIFNTYQGDVAYPAEYETTLAIQTWYHVAVIRGWGGESDKIVLCLDGIPGTPVTAYDLADDVEDGDFYIGGNSDGSTFFGYIDDFRLTKEVLWTRAFAVPSATYDPSTTTSEEVDMNYPVQVGIDAPSAACSATDASVAGNPDGTISYKVTFYTDRGSESNPSAASNDVTVASSKVALTDIEISSDPQVTQRRLYRTTDGGSSYLLLDTIENNYETTYTDNILDASLGAAAPSDNDVPPAFSYIKEHQGLLYGVEEAEENVLWYCNQFDELDHWNDTNYETLGSGDAVTHGLISFGNLLIALQRAYLWIFNTGDDTLERAFTNHGVHNVHSFLNTGDGILYIDVNGIFSYTTIAYDTMRSVPLHQLIGDIFDSESNNANRLDPDYVSNVRVGGIGDDIFISYTRQGQTTNDRTIHYNKEAKRVETLMDEGFVAFTHDAVNKNLYGCSTNGYIYKLLTGSDDNGTAISWSFSTKDFAKEFGSIVALKQAGWMFLDCNPNGETLTIQVYYDDTLVKTFTSDEASRYILRKKLPVPTQWNRVRFALSGSGKQYVYGLAFDGELTQRRRDSEIQR